MADLPEQIISRPGDLAGCLEHLADCRQFGFDTEFVGEDTYHPHLCLVQVATAQKLFLIDPLTVGPLDEFWKLVVDPANLVVAHAGREEVRLCQLWTGRPPGNLFDTQIAAGLVGLPYPLGHGAMVYQLLQVQLAKGETLTEWRDRPLTRQQIRYAFDDVRYLLPIWQKLSAQLAELGRADWVREELGRLAVIANPEDTSSERWRKLRGIGSLDRRRLAVVRELFLWREETAARSNRPARSILRDDLIPEIARRSPSHETDLKVVRGVRNRDLASIFEVMQRAHALPLEQCPVVTEREFDPPQLSMVVNLLSAVLGDFCSRQRLAANFVAGTNDLKLLVRAHLQGGPPPAESLLSQGWRSQAVLPELLAVLEGKRSVRIAKLSAESPFEYR